MIDRSFQLLRTNPRLTTNIKIIVSSDQHIYFESFDTNAQLSDNKYKHYLLDKESTYEYSLSRFYDGLPSQLAFDVKYDNDTQVVYNTYDKQFDDIYWSGAKSVEDKWHTESFEYFAPLYIKKTKLPEGFIILRVDDPISYEEKNNTYLATELTRDNFFNQVVDKWKCVSFFDLRYQTNIGYYLNNNIVDNDRFPVTPFDLDFGKYEFSRWYGIDYNFGVYSIKSKFMKDILDLEQPHFRLEKQITNGYKDNDLVFPNIWNLKFLFNDIPSTPEEYRDYSINRYYGFYIDDLEFVTNLTSYITPTIKSGVTLLNNIFMLDGVEMIETPFTEEYDVRKEYYVYWNNKFNEVVKIMSNGRYVYKIISEEDLTNIDFTKVNDRVCFISYQEGLYKCLSYENPSGYTNLVKGYTNDFAVDPYEYVTNIITPVYETRDMYADLYLIKIDNIYHVLKKRGNDYFIQTDYAINSYPEYLQYWKGGQSDESYKYMIVNKYGEKPLMYPVYRLKFSDIRDFDFDRVNTKFSNFDYEKDIYYTTSEQKLYAIEYSDLSIEKQFKIHPKGEDGQYQVKNISSEYIADDELYEIENDDLTEIWRKNQYINKWGYLGSNSHGDYPYKLNNSISVGDIFNRTVDSFSSIPDETSKNLDYFYRIGNLINSGSTKIRYLNQFIHLETELMDQTFSEKFNLDIFLNSNTDYFDYFFRNKMYYELYNQKYIKPTLKFAVFDGGNKYNRSSTIFKGLNFNILGIENITRDESNKISKFIVNQNTYNGYKFAIILNDVYKYYNPSFSNKVANGLQDNHVIDDEVNGIHIFLNDKYKNILCVLNVVIPFNSGYTNLNNVDSFSEKYGLYYAKTLSGDNLVGVSVPNNYKPNMLTSSNFINAINDMNNIHNFDSGVTYYYINSDGISGSTGPINLYISGNTMSQIDKWENVYPPYILTINYPEKIETKINSYIKGSIKGPATNIYNKYDTYYNSKASKSLEINEPLSRTIKINMAKETYNTIRHGEKIIHSNIIYRYNGKYEPIFKTISIFDVSNVYNSMDSGYTTVEYNYWSNNYKFNYDYGRFGVVDELIYSKVNPTINPLKLKNVYSDKSIYPMTDEYGYQFSNRFVFSSSWDKDFYVITKPDQIKNIKKGEMINISEVVINPPPTD